jgi:hypothetical protein
VVANPLYSESTSHVEVTAQHHLALQKMHEPLLKQKIATYKHLAYGLNSRDTTHFEQAHKYQEKFKSDHHHE